MGLLLQVVQDLKQEFGFLVDPKCKPTHCLKLLDVRVDDIFDCEPGDLVLYEGTYLAGVLCGKMDILHLEIALGGYLDGEFSTSATVGSLPSSSHPRTGGRD